MPLTAADRDIVTQFRTAIERRMADDARLSAAERDDRADESTLASRFAIYERIWLELTIRPFIPQVRAGIVTDDRWKNEDFEDRIEESGDTMSEFVEYGFDESGLAWREPLVEHFRDQGKYFCFVTSLELKSLADLNSAETRDKVLKMLGGYHLAFRPAIEKMKVAAQQA